MLIGNAPLFSYPFPASETVSSGVLCFTEGLAFKTIDGNIIALRPVLVIPREEMDWTLDILGEAIGEVEAAPGG